MGLYRSHTLSQISSGNISSPAAQGRKGRFSSWPSLSGRKTWLCGFKNPIVPGDERKIENCKRACVWLVSWKTAEVLRRSLPTSFYLLASIKRLIDAVADRIHPFRGMVHEAYCLLIHVRGRGRSWRSLLDTLNDPKRITNAKKLHGKQYFILCPCNSKTKCDRASRKTVLYQEFHPLS